MTLTTLFFILRSILYLWLGVEFLLLANIYFYGYRTKKRSPIIFSLQRLLLFSGLLFLFLAFIPVLVLLNTEVYNVTIVFSKIFLIPLIFYVRGFRKNSLLEKQVPLPKKETMKKKLPPKGKLWQFFWELRRHFNAWRKKWKKN